jgi:signal peptidase II
MESIETAGSRVPWHRQPRALLALVAAGVLVADLLTKLLVVAKLDYGQRVPLVGPLSFVLVRNPGAAFSMATGMTWVLTLIAVGVVVWIVRMGSRLHSRWWALGLGLVLGGALGNLVDRLFRAPGPMRGHVVDFISVGDWFPVFNVADSAITCAAVLLVVLTLLGKEPYGGFAKDTTEQTDGAGASPAEKGGTDA